MAVDSLATPEDLSAFPGAPFDDGLVKVAGESVRSDAGWHIAPVRTETLVVFGRGSRYLPLPTRRILSVTAVRFGNPSVEYTTGWEVNPGGLHRASGWPRGPVEVDLVHGYEQTPWELLPLIVGRIRSAGSVSEVRSDDQAVTFDLTGGGAAVAQFDALDRYRVPDGVA